MDMHAKIVAEAKAEREAIGYDPRWIDRDGNIVPHWTPNGVPIAEATGAIRSDAWYCGSCGWQNQRADGPICKDCGHDADTPVAWPIRRRLA